VEVNKQYHITERIGSAISLGTSKAKELEEKHKITATVGSALSSGMTSLTAALKGSSSKDSLPQVPATQQ
jgi:hypothetical protein